MLDFDFGEREIYEQNLNTSLQRTAAEIDQGNASEAIRVMLNDVKSQSVEAGYKYGVLVGFMKEFLTGVEAILQNGNNDAVLDLLRLLREESETISHLCETTVVSSLSEDGSSEQLESRIESLRKKTVQAFRRHLPVELRKALGALPSFMLVSLDGPALEW
eukprot:Tbor_TRINITY_DN3623_c0_g1::TRINITY_DN3623_c0_g1_i2::g.413::m.413